MPITNYTEEFSEQPNGSKSYTLRMYDQNGQQYTAPFYAPVGADVNTKVDESVDSMNVQLARDEMGKLIVELR